MIHPSIKPTHLERKAYVYLRQSSPDRLITIAALPNQTKMEQQHRVANLRAQAHDNMKETIDLLE